MILFEELIITRNYTLNTLYIRIYGKSRLYESSMITLLVIINGHAWYKFVFLFFDQCIS